MSKNLKYSSTEPRELKVVETQKVVNSLKDSQPLYTDFVKNVGKLTQHLQNNVPYDSVSDSLEKIAEHSGGDLEGGFRAFLNCQNQLKEQRDNVTNTWQRSVFEEYMEKDPSIKGNKLDADKQRVVSFLKDFSNNRASSLKSVKKAESELNKASKKKALKKDPSRADSAADQLKEMIDSHNEFLSDELRAIALIERKKYLALLKQLNVVLDSQAHALEASLAQVKKTQEGIAKLLAPDEEENLTQSLREIIASGPSLVDKKTGDVEKLDGSGSFINRPPSLTSAPEPVRKNTSFEEVKPQPQQPSPQVKAQQPQQPQQPAAAGNSESLDSYLNALNDTASFFTPIKDSDDEDSDTEESSDDEDSGGAGGGAAALQPAPTADSAEGDALRSLLKSFEGDRSVYVDRLN